MSASRDYGKQETKNGQIRQNQETPKSGKTETGPRLLRALQLLKTGARVTDLSPEEMRELAAMAGNQTVLGLFESGSGSLPLASVPYEKEQEAAGLPVNQVEIRWPALVSLPELPEQAAGAGSAFPVEQLRPTGAYEFAGSNGGLVYDNVFSVRNTVRSRAASCREEGEGL